MRRVKVRLDPTDGRWVWTCYLCSPTTVGGTHDQQHTYRNIKRHCERYRYHHAWVAKNKRLPDPPGSERVNRSK